MEAAAVTHPQITPISQMKLPNDVVNSFILLGEIGVICGYFSAIFNDSNASQSKTRTTNPFGMRWFGSSSLNGARDQPMNISSSP
jgi:hypothetical protein